MQEYGVDARIPALIDGYGADVAWPADGTRPAVTEARIHPLTPCKNTTNSSKQTLLQARCAKSFLKNEKFSVSKYSYFGVNNHIQSEYKMSHKISQ